MRRARSDITSPDRQPPVFFYLTPLVVNSALFILYLLFTTQATESKRKNGRVNSVNNKTKKNFLPPLTAHPYAASLCLNM
nr:hypothetical protein [Cronobacter malonaticus]EGT4417586.1 hypothetical protein [Cronobacter malonaticus]